jgi:hypothetical protein
LRLHQFVAIALLGSLSQAFGASPDATWFERCQPSDGAGQALTSGASIAFFNPLPRDSGALFLGITLPPRTELRFAGSHFLAVAPGGSSSIELHPMLLTFNREAVDDQASAEFGSNGKLVNKSLSEIKFSLRLAENGELPNQFTLLLPPISVGGHEQDSLAVHYRRFTPGGYVQVCGVNGATRVAPPATR